MKGVFILSYIIFLFGKTNSKIVNGLFKSCSVLDNKKNIDLDNLCIQKETYECNFSKSILQSFLINNNKFNLIENNHIKKVVFSNDNKLYETVCLNIDIIDILEDTTFGNPKKCFNDIEVQFKNKEEKIVKGFLTKNGVIRGDSEEINCDDSEKIFRSLDKSIAIIRKKDFSLIIESLGNQFKKIKNILKQ